MKKKSAGTEPFICDIEKFKELCRVAQLRVTPQRVAVYQALASTTTHPDVDSVYNMVAKKMPEISLDTVYRTLEQFSACEIIMKMEVLQGRYRYDANTMRHAHFACKVCGCIIDLRHEEFLHLPYPGNLKKIGAPSSMHLQIRGVCKECGKHKI